MYIEDYKTLSNKIKEHLNNGGIHNDHGLEDSV